MVNNPSPAHFGCGSEGGNGTFEEFEEYRGSECVAFDGAGAGDGATDEFVEFDALDAGGAADDFVKEVAFIAVRFTGSSNDDAFVMFPYNELTCAGCVSAAACAIESLWDSSS